MTWIAEGRLLPFFTFVYFFVTESCYTYKYNKIYITENYYT